MLRPTVGKPRGILRPALGQEKFQLSRYAPAPDLSFFIEHYWIVRWDLRDQSPYRSETLPHPSVHLVFEKNNSRIVGVVKGKFTYLLKAAGVVFGVKFKPGAFYPFVKTPVSSFTDSSLSVDKTLDVDGSAFENAILSLDDDRDQIDRVEACLRPRLPERDEMVPLIGQIVDRIRRDRAITQVDDLAARLHVSPRSLQRLFSQYVGVSPKWVIQRCRLHEAVEQLADGEVADWPRLAQELGYFDQAHFIKDFKTVVGTSPAAYARQLMDKSIRSL